MHTTREELPVLLEDGPACIRATDWGGQRALLVSLPAGMDITPLLRGLPDDRCQCPHWGYVLAGRMRVIYTGGQEETLEAGDLWYLPPGHTVIVDEDVEFVESARRESTTRPWRFCTRTLRRRPNDASRARSPPGARMIDTGTRRKL